MNNFTNRDAYSPIRDQENGFDLATSPRISVPFGRKTASPRASSMLSEAFNSSKSVLGSDSSSTGKLPVYQDNSSASYDLISNTVNPILMKKLQERQTTCQMLEITSSGNADDKTMSLRDLLVYINSLATSIDTKFFGANNGSFRENANSTANTHQSGSFLRPHHLEEDSANGSSPMVRESKSDGLQYLRHRDLRRLEYNFNPLGEPTLFVRRHAVIVSLDPIRAVVMADRLLLIVSEGMDSVLELFDKNINAWSDSSSLPFEARAYEGIFSTIIAIQTEEYEVFNNQTLNVLSDYKNASIISLEKQEQLRVLKNKVTGMLVRVSAYKNVIVELLDEDHDMALMNLSRLKKKPSLYQIPLSFEILSTHEEIEVLLESYLVDYNYLISKLEFLKSQILSAEELVLLRLDTSRNQLLIADTLIAIVACCVGFGSFIGSIFGMNLKNYHENDAHSFHVVTTFTVMGISGLAVSTVVLLKCLGVIPSEYLSINFYKTQSAYTHQYAHHLASQTGPPSVHHIPFSISRSPVPSKDLHSDNV